MSCFRCCEEDEIQKAADNGGMNAAKNTSGNLLAPWEDLETYLVTIKRIFFNVISVDCKKRIFPLISRDFSLEIM